MFAIFDHLDKISTNADNVSFTIKRGSRFEFIKNHDHNRRIMAVTTVLLNI